MASSSEDTSISPPPTLSSSTTEQNVEEDAALLSEKPTSRSRSPSSSSSSSPSRRITHPGQRNKRRRTWTEISLFAWAVLATLLVIIFAVLYQHPSHHERTDRARHDSKPPKGKRNLIFMVSDGMGPTALTLTRSYLQHANDFPYNHTLSLDGHAIGQSRTRSTTSLITDSAAGATAFTCGNKSYNGAISVLPDHKPCGTVLEAAKLAGYHTGLVVTTRITDATPACFAAHVSKRDEEDRIAEQLLGHTPLGRVVDLMLGAGRCHFLPNDTRSDSSNSCRDDQKNLIEEAKEHGWNYIDSRREFDGLKRTTSDLPLLGLFADTDIPFEIDRRQEGSKYPSLAEMSRTALETLQAATEDSEQGFFLMIEGSRIDHAGHANDPVAEVHEVLAYDAAFQVVLDFLQKEQEKEDESTQSLLLATSDHETGGLATARQLRPYEYPEYLWHPSMLAKANHSVEFVGRNYAAHLKDLVGPDSAPADLPEDSEQSKNIKDYLRLSLHADLGIVDPSKDEMSLLMTRPRFAPYYFADMISRRAQTGWTTHGHSGADVNVYTSDFGPVTDRLKGSVENEEIGRFMKWYLGVEGQKMDEVEARLRGAREKDWMGPVPEDGERLDGQSHVEGIDDHYDGEY